MIRQRMIGLAACLALLAILAGLPAVLIAVAGNPLPDTWPAWGQVGTALTRPDDGTLALTAIVWLGWATWVVLAGSTILEVLASARGARAPRLPVVSVPQLAARTLLSAAALLFAATPVTSPASAGMPSVAATATQQSEPAHNNGATATGRDQGASPPERATTAHTVRPGDTLWALAEHYLGDGHRYREIADANRDLIGDPDFLRTGWTVTVPLDQASKATKSRYTVQEGDTLSGIASAQLGDPGRYPEIARASQGITQPGGQHLADPDLILPGWTLAIPGAPAATARTASPPAADTAAPPPATLAPSTPDTTAPSTPEPDRPAPAEPGDRDEDEEARSAGTGAATAARSAADHGAVPGSDQAARAAQAELDADGTEHADALSATWVLSGLAGAGVLLAGSIGLLLRRNRATQFRARRPGRALPAPDPVLAPVEKTLHIQQPTCGARVTGIDRAFRQLAAMCAEQGIPAPAVAAAQLTGDRLSVHLSEPVQLPHPWTVVGDMSHWARHLPGQAPSSTPEEPAPYPLLVTIGEGDDGSVWLLNLEVFGTVALAGDPTYAGDFARYLAAEVACNPWAQDVHLHCVGVATETARMNPRRVHVHDDVDQTCGQVLAETIAQTDRANQADTTVSAARAAQSGEDLWLARLLLVQGPTTCDSLGHLLGVVDQHPQQSGTVVVVSVATEEEPAPQLSDDVALTIDLTSNGRVRLPSVGLDLIAAGLTVDEAGGIAALLEQSTLAGDRPVPCDQDAPPGTWRAYTDHAGALRADYTVPRTGTTNETCPVEAGPTEEPDHEGADAAALTGAEADHAATLLPHPDADYLLAGATTAGDLARLAPGVSASVREHVTTLDPTLDDDVAAWFAKDCPLPRLTLLGPVKARTRGRAVAVASSKDYYIELLAYLGTRPAGATMEEVAAAFSIAAGTVRKHISHLRDWLGTNPRTGQPHLPDARNAPAAQHRGAGVYQVQDLLIDADLFRRLRARAQMRGASGVDDLCTALRLVTGVPLDPGSLRPTGWSWMLTHGDRLDQHLLVAVVDVAHLVTTASLAQGDLDRATAATDVAVLAAPEEEIPRLDLAAIAAATGDENKARGILTEDIGNRADNDRAAPDDLPERTRAILRTRAWPATHAS